MDNYSLMSYSRTRKFYICYFNYGSFITNDDDNNIDSYIITLCADRFQLNEFTPAYIHEMKSNPSEETSWIKHGEMKREKYALTFKHPEIWLGGGGNGN